MTVRAIRRSSWSSSPVTWIGHGLLTGRCSGQQKMSLQESVSLLARMGPLPNSHDASPSVLKETEVLLDSIPRPVSNDDARILVTLFGPDDCNGLAWSLLHLIETAPGWPLADCLESPQTSLGQPPKSGPPITRGIE